MTDHDWAKAFADEAVLAEAERIVRDSLYDDPPVGTPASVGVGSDSYPAVVTDVVRFKTGARAGKVRAISVAHIDYDPDAVTDKRATGGYGKDFTVDVTHPSVKPRGHAETYTRRDKHGGVRWVREGSDWQSVGLGVARDYRDPHF